MFVREILAMVVAFTFLIFFPKKRLWTGFVLLLTGLIIGIASGQGLIGAWRNFIAIPTSPATVKTIIVVLQVGVLSTLMKHYGVLDKLVAAFENVFSSAKTVIMLLPTAFGMLAVPGGAQLSSPFVHKLGESMGISVEKRAAVNLTFRHLNYFILPTSASMIVFSNLAPHVSLYRLIALNVGFIVLMLITSYLLYLRDAPTAEIPATGRRLAGLRDIVIYLSPIYLIPLLNGILGIEMYLCGFISLLLIFVAWGIKSPATYCRVFCQGVNLKTLVTLLGIYYIQNTVRNLSGIMGAFQAMFLQTSGLTILLVIAAATLLFGLTTGLSYLPQGILIPLLIGLGLPAAEELIYCFFIYTWSFLGYFFSPLHLCQVLTLHQMGGDIAKLDRLYIPLMCESAVSTFVLFYLYKFILL